MKTGVLKRVICGFCVLAVLYLLVIGRAQAKKRNHGEQLYAENCQACHSINSNIINPEKTILKSGRLKSIGDFKQFLSHENGLMPAYKTIVRDPKALGDLYRYIVELKQSPRKQN